MKKYIVTGGAGFIGSHTVVALVEAGYEPVIIDNFSNSERTVLNGLHRILNKEIKYYIGDCQNEIFLGDVLAKEKDIAGVIHFAALKAVGESVKDPILYYQNNLDSLLVLLKMMIEQGIPNFVFSSSATVYGEPDDLPAREDTPIKPATCAYGNTKQIGEEIIRDVVNSGAPVKSIALRYFNPIGAHPTGFIGELPLGVPNNLVPFITQTAAGLREKLTVFGNDYPTPDGTCVRDYIHVMDLAIAHVKAIEFLERQEAKSHFDCINVGTGQGHTVLDVINTFEGVTGQKLNYQIGARRPGDAISTYANVDKAKQVLGWTAERDLADAMRDAWNFQSRLKSDADE